MSDTSPDVAEAAAQVVCDALEEIAFLAGDRMPPDSPPPEDPDVLWAMIPAHGTQFTRMTLFAKESVARRVAETALGLESVNDSQIFDALAETANTACGSLARLLTPTSEHGLGLPETGRGLPSVKGTLLATEYVDLEGDWFGVRVEG